jgi:hypothetical protein
MGHAMHAATVALVSLLMAAVLPAQDRLPLVGRTLDAQGKPVSGATVTLVWDQPDLAGLVPPDVVTARSDERGRFVGSVLRGVSYFGFAVAPEQEGVTLISDLQRDLRPGRPCELTCNRQGRPRTVKLTGLEAWGEPSSLGARLAFSDVPGYCVPLAVDAAGKVALPPWELVAHLELTDRDGSVLCRVWAHESEAEVPAPTKLRVRVVDDKGKAIAGATVLVRHDWDRVYHYCPYMGVGSICRRAGVTGADGTLEVKVSCEEDNPFETAPRRSLVLLCQKEGFAEGASGWLEGPMVDWRVGVEHQKAEVRITLQPAQPFSLRLQGSDLAGKTVRLLAMGHAEFQNGYMYLPRRYDVTVGADGSVVVPWFPLQAGKTLLELPPQGGHGPLLLPLPGRDAGVIDLGQLRPLTIEVLDRDKGPATGAVVFVVPRDGDHMDIAHAPLLVPDTAGRIDVRVQAGSWHLLAFDATGWAELEVPDPLPQGRLCVQLEPKPSMRVRIVDRAGKPVTAARLELDGIDADVRMPVTGLPRLRAALGYNLLAEEVFSLPIDAKGEAVVFFLPQPRATPRLVVNSKDHGRSAPFALVAGEGDAVTVVTLGK